MDPKPISSKLDPEDDAPELTDEELDKLFENGVWRIGDRIVSPEEGMAAMREALANPEPPPQQEWAQVDVPTLETFYRMGPHWNFILNVALRDWLREHPEALGDSPSSKPPPSSRDQEGE